MYEHLTGRVSTGKKLGRKIGFPTINLALPHCWLPEGTYKVTVIIGEKKYSGIWPFFPEKQLFEVHILNFSGDLYGQEVTIIPVLKIRENQQFWSIKELTQQITQDILTAQQHVQRVITFGTFDYVHPGHLYYLTHASRYGDQLITIVARDETVCRIKWVYPDHDEHMRVAAITQLHLADIVELGDPVDYYTCLRTYRPAVICLGYDQHSFDAPLQQRCNEHLPDTTILRLESFQPEKRKSSLMKKDLLN